MPRSLRRQPERSGEGTTGEDGAIAGAVAEGELLARPGEKHGVLSGQIARAYAGGADLSLGCAAAAGSRGAQRERSAGGGVAFAAVMHLEDIDIEGRRQRTRARSHQLREEADRDTGVRRDEYGDLARGACERRLEPRLDPRGADQQRLVRGPTGLEIGSRCRRLAEIDGDVGIGERARQVAAHDETGRSESCELPGIAPQSEARG